MEFVLLLLLLIALQPFAGLWPLFFSFFILYAVGRTPCTGDQPVTGPLPTHRTVQTLCRLYIYGAIKRPLKLFYSDVFF
jgi:hypothetical protein